MAKGSCGLWRGFPPLFLRIFFLSLTCFLLSIQSAQAINLVQGDLAPDFTAITLDGKPVTLSDFKGKPVFVVFWSSWCSRCKEEMEFLRELQKNYSGVAFLAINSESDDPEPEDIERIERTVRDWEIPFTVLVDAGLRIWDLYGIQALPTSLIVGKDGMVTFVEPNFYFASPDNFENALLEMFEPKPKYSLKEPLTEQP